MICKKKKNNRHLTTISIPSKKIPFFFFFSTKPNSFLNVGNGYLKLMLTIVILFHVIFIDNRDINPSRTFLYILFYNIKICLNFLVMYVSSNWKILHFRLFVNKFNIILCKYFLCKHHAYIQNTKESYL